MARRRPSRERIPRWFRAQQGLPSADSSPPMREDADAEGELDGPEPDSTAEDRGRHGGRAELRP